MATARVLTAGRDQVGECPIWDADAQALYWVDINGCCIHRLDWASGAQQTWSTPERVGCIALDTQGRIIAALESGIYLAHLGEPSALQLVCLAPIHHPRPHMRFNDGRCDAMGRFWVSTMCMDMTPPSPVGAWMCLDSDGLRPTPLGGLITANGLAFSPDGRTMYYSDSHPSVQTIWACDYDLAAGTPGPRRVFVDMAPLPGRPDGAAVDVEGHYWICANDAGLVHRFDPQGRLVASLPVPVPKPSMCAFGGPQRDVLLVTSIRAGDAATPLCGAVFALEPGVQGLPEPRFSRFPVAAS